MMKLGRRHMLTVVKTVDFGVYLGSNEERVLLPKKQVPEGIEVGDPIEVFLYKDSEDRLIATTNMPKIELGELAVLSVADTNKFGAFLNWGLEKDLFLPFKQQTAKVKKGDQCLVSLYIDKSDRLCATMNVYPYLRTDSPYKKEDRVSGVIYQISDNFGAFVAVDGQFSGLVPKKEMYGNIKIGDTVDARVTSVKEDGKLDLSIREKAYIQLSVDGEKIMALIDSYDGVLPFNDKVSPEIIRRETQMSKNEFKRAVGHLLKEGRIEIGEKVIRRV